MREKRAGDLLARKTSLQRISVTCTRHHNMRAQFSELGPLGQAGNFWHKHFAAHPKFFGSCGRGNSCVTARRHNHAAFRNRVGQQAIKHAACFKTASCLHMLQLEPDFLTIQPQRFAGQLPERCFKNKVLVTYIELA